MKTATGIKRRREWDESQQSSILNFFSKSRPVPKTISNSNPTRKKKRTPADTTPTRSTEDTLSAAVATVSPSPSEMEQLRPPSIASRPAPPKKKSTQLYLDFGQRNFGQQIVCPICNMLYVHGVAEDLQRHEIICKEYRDGVTFQLTKCRIVWQQANAMIVEVRLTDGSAVRQKVADATQIVNQELGFAADSKAESRPKTTFLYIRQKRIVALATVEILQQAYPLNDNHRTPVKATLGVYKLWTHAKARNQGVASRLIDVARKKMVFGTIVPIQRVAFSSPTQAGAQFAQKYLQKSSKEEEPQVLVYDLH